MRRSISNPGLPRLLVCAFACSLVLTGCGSGDGAAKANVNVVATTIQIAALTRQVGGERLQMHQIIPAGADPHEFEPKADDLKAIAEAGLVLRHGVGLDAFVDKAISGASSARVVTVTDGLPLKPPALEAGGASTDSASGTRDSSGFDPHVWHDPELDKMIVDNIRNALDEADPDGKDVYNRHAEAYKQVLDRTDAQIRELIDTIPPANRKFVTNHDALGYFARRYGLAVVGAVIPSSSTQAEASAGETAKLLETIRAQGVKAIFAESSVNPDLATQIAREAGVRIVDNLYGDSLGEPGSGADTVDGMLLTNARLIADALR